MAWASVLAAWWQPGAEGARWRYAILQAVGEMRFGVPAGELKKKADIIPAAKPGGWRATQAGCPAIFIPRHARPATQARQELEWDEAAPEFDNVDEYRHPSAADMRTDSKRRPRPGCFAGGKRP